eukprot:TRINITY_DN5841_c0_g1_i1.p1 TRINITY_DN5841_c0_g1~~TRINITY_DN5841_c0_g1_i1.p1  ORF type:complete len:163 (+),score=22.79 TRINITY_DN5841_c0_g1_i1:224-712(+)
MTSSLDLDLDLFAKLGSPIRAQARPISAAPSPPRPDPSAQPHQMGNAFPYSSLSLSRSALFLSPLRRPSSPSPLAQPKKKTLQPSPIRDLRRRLAQSTATVFLSFLANCRFVIGSSLLLLPCSSFNFRGVIRCDESQPTETPIAHAYPFEAVSLPTYNIFMR